MKGQLKFILFRYIHILRSAPDDRKARGGGVIMGLMAMYSYQTTV
ncbi:MAG: hypothetical protein AB8Y53_00780 [Coxiella-like endosymbiont]